MTDCDVMGFLNASKKYGSQLGLERIARLCELAGCPQDKVPAVHVAGTNGKGSTSAMIASVLTASGCKTGLYTSPYVGDVRQCMQIDGECISRAEFEAVAGNIAQFAARMAAEGAPPTEFELETAIAFRWFFESHCDMAVIETGLGGRLDATNVICKPLVCVITSISLDHTNILGTTLNKIATEKCGIIKPGGITVSYPLQGQEVLAVISQSADAQGNTLVVPNVDQIAIHNTSLDGTDIAFHGLELHIPLIGRHQVWNTATAVEAVLALRDHCGFTISDSGIIKGIANTAMPLRQEVVCTKPVILLDGAHNPDGLAALADTMITLLAGRRTAVVMGMLADKEYQKSIAMITTHCGKFIAVKPDNARALESSIAADEARAFCPDVSVNDDYAGALAEAVRFAGQDGAVVVCGSLYLAGPVRQAYFEDPERFA